MKITDKTGALISIKNVTDENDLMIINKSGITIRLALSDLRTTGRATQGVKVINLRSNDQIASVAKVSAYKEDEEVQSEEGSSDSETNAQE
jgi:DNA gyrase subunit A